MPIYEYKCPECGAVSEIMHSMSDESVRSCEACGNQGLERLISRTSFALKGGGWYKDLYSSTKPSGSGSADSSSSGSSGSSDSSSSSGSGSSGSGSSGSGSSSSDS
ncbi:MAG: zinc ribbon domain-containing protein [Deltaproteobacteria bacterium]|nr:zinc ribbon domain-containing protein [Deltaproteobacteria bacterium]